jgi:hypothetical protein
MHQLQAQSPLQLPCCTGETSLPSWMLPIPYQERILCQYRWSWIARWPYRHRPEFVGSPT